MTVETRYLLDELDYQTLYPNESYSARVYEARAITLQNHLDNLQALLDELKVQ